MKELFLKKLLKNIINFLKIIGLIITIDYVDIPHQEKFYKVNSMKELFKKLHSKTKSTS